MKRLCLVVCVSMIVVFGLAALAWAQEATVVDSVENVIIRAYIQCTGGDCSNTPPTTTPTYSAYLEVRNSKGTFVSGTYYDPNEIVVTNVTDALNPQTLTADTEHKYIIHDNNLTNPDINMYLDTESGITYVFCTDAGDGWHIMKFVIVNNANVADGVCGATNNSCTSGTLDDIADSGANYLWNCLGVNGGSDAECSLAKPVDGACGATNNSCTSGTFSDDADTATQSKWSCLGISGGSDATCSLTKVNGACGTTNNSCTSGTLQDIADSGTNYLWNCLGSNGGSDGSCSLAKPSGSPDLVVSGLSGIYSGYQLNVAMNFTITITNQGNASTAVANACSNGNLTVRVYQNSSGTASGTPNATWNVGSDLNASQSMTNTLVVYPNADCGIHTYCKFVVKVDADDCITESNETNNIKTHASYRLR